MSGSRRCVPSEVSSGAARPKWRNGAPGKAARRTSELRPCAPASLRLAGCCRQSDGKSKWQRCCAARNPTGPRSAGLPSGQVGPARPVQLSGFAVVVLQTATPFRVCCRAYVVAIRAVTIEGESARYSPVRLAVSSLARERHRANSTCDASAVSGANLLGAMGAKPIEWARGARKQYRPNTKN